MHMTAPEIHGDRIYAYLLANGPETHRGLRVALGLSHSQVESGLRYIREVLADYYDQPFAPTPGTWTYEVDVDEVTALRYIRYRIAIIYRYLLNLNSGTISPALAKFANPSIALLQHTVHQLADSAEFVLEDLLPTP